MGLGQVVTFLCMTACTNGIVTIINTLETIPDPYDAFHSQPNASELINGITDKDLNYFIKAIF